MIPLRLTLKNFLTYRGQHSFDFDGASLWVLSGLNGTGKSSVFDAITFALFNQNRAGSGSKTAKLLINHKADTAEVEFDFCVNNQLYRVRRTIAKRGHPTRQAYQFNSSDQPLPIAGTQLEDEFKNWVKSVVGEYETFTTSVLLLQGQSTKLLDAKPIDRFKILGEIINLAPYKRLHELAVNRAKTYQIQSEEHHKRLGTLAVVEPKAISSAQATLTQLETDCQTHQTQIDRLIATAEQSKHWQQQQSKLQQQKQELAQKEQLRDRSAEIKVSYERLQSLKSLPLLSTLLENRDRATKYQQEMNELDSQNKAIEHELTLAEQFKQAEEAQVAQLNNEIVQLQEQRQQLADELLELAPIVAKLIEIQETQTQMAQLEQQLTSVPVDLETEVHKAEERDQYLQEVKQVLPWLQQLSTAHHQLDNTWKAGLAARERAKMIGQQLQECHSQREPLNKEVETLAGKKQALDKEIHSATKHHTNLLDKLQSFTDVALKPICDLCGQTITPEHATQEKTRLSQQIAAAQSDLDSLNHESQKTQTALVQTNASLKEIEAKISTLQQDLSSQDTECQVLRSQVKQYTQQIQSAFENLPESYQTQISTVQLLAKEDYLQATPFSPTQIQDLQKEKETHPENTTKLKVLRNQFQEAQRWQIQQQQVRDRLNRLLDDCSLEEAKTAQERQVELQERRKAVESQITQYQNTLKTVNQRVQQTQQDIQALHNRQQTCRANFASKEATHREVQRSIQTCLESLPSEWQESAIELEAHQLDSLKVEYNTLTEYDALWSELQFVDRLITQLMQQIEHLSSEIAAIPTAAQRPEQGIQQELAMVKAQFSILDQERKAADHRLTQLKRDQEQRLQLEQEQRQAERHHELYKALAKLLSPKGFQLYLIRQAERAIVELANETLDNLSRGRLRLELRNDKDEQVEKALDLVVYDREAGATETAIALTSGSQRFRIAVSLALAIGRYTSQESRRIESVIIDEGFGGLDKHGRDDMIHELNALQQQLQRIILVSHQEEFASAFPNGYWIQLVDGSSHISKLVP